MSARVIRCIFCQMSRPLGRYTATGSSVCQECADRIDSMPSKSAREELEDAFDEDLKSEYWMGRSLSEYIDDYRAEILREAAEEILDHIATRYGSVAAWMHYDYAAGWRHGMATAAKKVEAA